MREITKREYNTVVDEVYKSAKKYRTGHGNYLAKIFEMLGLSISDEEFLKKNSILLNKMFERYELAELLEDEIDNDSKEDGQFLMECYASMKQDCGEIEDYREGLEAAYREMCEATWEIFFTN